MIKRLQLRGISRKPSDRYTEDGGCAESLNVFIDNDETAPALKPTVVNTSMKDEKGRAMFPYESWQTPWEAVFIHKTPNFERAIIKYGAGDTIQLGVWEGNGCSPIMPPMKRDDFIRCINLGNSLGVVAKNGTHWVLLKGGKYQYVGTNIPFPAFTIANIDVPASSEQGGVIRSKTITRPVDWETGRVPTEDGLAEESLNYMWGEIDKMIANNAGHGVYDRQQFAVFAIRLFDGTRVISCPTLLSPGYDNPYDISGYTFQLAEQYTITLKAAYKIFFRLDVEPGFFSTWEDIVDSFEVYLSPQIEIDRTKSYFTSFRKSGMFQVNGDLVLGKKNSELESYLNASNFYRVYSAPYNAENFDKLRNGLVLDTSDYMSTDSLVTAGIRLDTLSDMKHYEVKFTRSTLYNNKIVASGISEEVRMEMHNPISTYYYNTALPQEFHPTYTYRFLHDEVLAYRLTFYLRDSTGGSVAVKATNNGSEYFFFRSQMLDGKTLWSNGYGMIYCPDPRAFAVDIQAIWGTPSNIMAGRGNIIGAATLSLTEHPNLNCSYWYGDIEKELIEFCTQSATYTPGKDSYEDKMPNKVYVSEMDNPFVFPISSRYTMNSEVLGTAIATDALSTGQFGQFPIYVFTKEGLWAMESASDGTIVSTKPLSREVCTNPDSITPIDNAVVFVTEKAVMLVSGSQITDLSPFMNGEHYAMSATSREGQLINNGDWAAYLTTLVDDTHFMAFMENAMIGYDYKGNRLVFVNDKENYQYVFMLRTNTWHKMLVDGFGTTLLMSNVLNAYPDTYVNVQAGNRHYIWDLSSKLDVTSSVSLKGVIVTRPFDLDNPDVRKTINDIRIRGRFNRIDARYILLGSMDGINWGVLPTLHGGSYKWFRLIILTSLSPTERISWIDVNYDTKMTNRFR